VIEARRSRQRREVAGEDAEEPVADAVHRRGAALPDAVDFRVEQLALDVVDGQLALELDALGQPGRIDGFEPVCSCLASSMSWTTASRVPSSILSSSSWMPMNVASIGCGRWSGGSRSRPGPRTCRRADLRRAARPGGAERGRPSISPWVWCRRCGRRGFAQGGGAGRQDPLDVGGGDAVVGHGPDGAVVVLDHEDAAGLERRGRRPGRGGLGRRRSWWRRARDPAAGFGLGQAAGRFDAVHFGQALGQPAGGGVVFGQPFDHAVRAVAQGDEAGRGQTPTWRIPPPTSFRPRQALWMNSRDPDDHRADRGRPGPSRGRRRPSRPARPAVPASARARPRR
jgi:hypothetical protein